MLYLWLVCANCHMGLSAVGGSAIRALSAAYFFHHSCCGQSKVG